MMPLVLREFERKRLAESLAGMEYAGAFRALAEAEMRRDPFPSEVLRAALEIECGGQKREVMIALLERHIRKTEMGGR